MMLLILCNTSSDWCLFHNIYLGLRTVRCKITGYLNILCNPQFFSATHGLSMVIKNGVDPSNYVMLGASRIGCVRGCMDGVLWKGAFRAS